MSILEAILYNIEVSTDVKTLYSVLTPAAREKYGDRLEEWINTPTHTMLRVDDDFTLWEWRGGTKYEGHFFFTSKGRKALDNAQKMIDEVKKTGVGEIIGYIPVDLKPARWFVRQLGFKSNGFVNGALGISEYFTLKD